MQRLVALAMPVPATPLATPSSVGRSVPSARLRATLRRTEMAERDAMKALRLAAEREALDTERNRRRRLHEDGTRQREQYQLLREAAASDAGPTDRVISLTHRLCLCRTSAITRPGSAPRGLSAPGAPRRYPRPVSSVATWV